MKGQGWPYLLLHCFNNRVKEMNDESCCYFNVCGSEELLELSFPSGKKLNPWLCCRLPQMQAVVVEAGVGSVWEVNG